MNKKILFLFCTLILFIGFSSGEIIKTYNAEQNKIIIHQEYNPSMIQYNQEGYDYKTAGTPYTFYVKSNSNYGDGIKYCVESEGENFCLIYQAQDMSFRDSNKAQDYISSVQGTNGNIEGETITYLGLFPNVSLEYSTNEEGIKENFILSSKPRQPATYLGQNISLDFGGYIKFPNLHLFADGEEQTTDFVTDGRIDFRTGSGKLLFYLPEPYAVDSAGEKLSLQYEVDVRGSEIWFYTRTNFAWLNSSDRVYPVYIDPSIEQEESSYTLLENSDFCNKDCYAIGKVFLKEDSRIFDGVDFYLNNTIINLSESNIFVKNMSSEGWEVYDYSVLPAGDYFWKLTGKKQSNWAIDWIVNVLGLHFTEWAWWNSWGDWNDDFSDTFVNQTIWEDKIYNCTYNIPGDGNRASVITEGQNNVSYYTWGNSAAGKGSMGYTKFITRQDFNDSKDYDLSFRLNSSYTYVSVKNEFNLIVTNNSDTIIIDYLCGYQFHTAPKIKLFTFPNSVSNKNYTLLIRGNNFSLYNDSGLINSTIVNMNIWRIGFEQISAGYGGEVNSQRNYVYNFTVSSDSTSPNVTINSPLNQSYNSKSATFNITAIDDSGVNACWVSLDGGTTNQSLTNSEGDFWTYTNSSMIEDSFIAQYYCDDGAGNLNNTESVSFTMDFDGIPSWVNPAGWTVSMRPTEEVFNTWELNNTGIGNLTNCVPSVSGALASYITFDNSNFNLSVGESKDIKVTITHPAEASYSASLSAICNLSSTEQVQSASNVSISVTSTLTTVGTTGGGGSSSSGSLSVGSTPCNLNLVRPTTKIVLDGKAGTTSAKVLFIIENTANATSNFDFTLSPELNKACVLKTNRASVNGKSTFENYIECVFQDETLDGKITIRSDIQSCDSSISVAVTSSSFGKFVSILNALIKGENISMFGMSWPAWSIYLIAIVLLFGIIAVIVLIANL